MNDVALLGLLAALHLLALAAGAVLVLALARGDDRRGQGGDGTADEGGSPPSPPSPPPPPPIGPPLAHAGRSRVRLRQAGRIADRRPRRRPYPAPAPPRRRGAPRAARHRPPS